MISRVTVSGQTTIPPPIFQKLGLKAGDWVNFEERNGAIVLTKTEPTAEEQWTLGLSLTLNEWEGDADDDLLAV